MLLAVSLTVGATAFTGLILAALFKYLRPSIVKDDYVPCAGGWHESELHGCSQGLLKVPQQPINTFSNLAYIAAGAFVVAYLATPAAGVFAFTMLYLCIGSALYHATSTRWAGMMDVTGIYAVFSGLAVYAACVLVGSPMWLTTGVMFLVAGATAYVLSPRYHRNMQLIIGIFLGLAYVLTIAQMWLSADWSPGLYVLVSFLLFALAFLVWILDKRRLFPIAGWGHGLWHVLTAAAAGMVFYGTYLSG